VAAGKAGKNNDVLSQMGKAVGLRRRGYRGRGGEHCGPEEIRKLIEGDKNKDKGPEPGKAAEKAVSWGKLPSFWATARTKGGTYEPAERS